jgi:Na+/phosphate symporter
MPPAKWSASATTIEVCLSRIIELYEKPDQARINELAALDDRVDKKHAAIKLYLTRLATHELTDFESLRMQELLGACVKLEQVGDIIVRNIAWRMFKRRWTTSWNSPRKAGRNSAISTPWCWPMRIWLST